AIGPSWGRGGSRCRGNGLSADPVSRLEGAATAGGVTAHASNGGEAVMTTKTRQIETCSKKVRGMAQKSLDLIEALYAVAKAAQPITGRGIGYKLFTAGLIPSMARNEMQRVYRLLKEAREQGIIPWEWIVDETRALERVSTWSNPAEYADCVARSYR